MKDTEKATVTEFQSNKNGDEIPKICGECGEMVKHHWKRHWSRSHRGLHPFTKGENNGYVNKPKALGEVKSHLEAKHQLEKWDLISQKERNGASDVVLEGVDAQDFAA